MDDLLFGLRTTVLGMAFVFAILAIVWGLLNVLMRLDARTAARASTGAAAAAPVAIEHGPAAAETGPPGAPDTVVRLVGAPADLDPRLVAAVAIAVLRHEEARRLQAAPAMRSYWPGSLLFASRWVAAGRTRQGQSWRRRR
jgi:Na+-transporting methylmalonyl-CoA/oxaloacetate decarboxylase gamma subunit